jgi:hypothetical protein
VGFGVNNLHDCPASLVVIVGLVRLGRGWPVRRRLPDATHAERVADQCSRREDVKIVLDARLHEGASGRPIYDLLL